MEIVRDLAGGSKPQPLNLFYNTEDDADGTEVRYRGSLVKMMDWNNAAGIQCCWAGESTAYENIIGILEEDPGITGNYLLNDASFGAVTRKITPLLPTSIVRAEYSQNDPTGTSNLDTNATAAAAGTTLTLGDAIGADDLLIGAWIYCTNGDNVNKLHYITDSANSGETATLATATTGAIIATDDLVVVQPPMTLWLALDAEEVNLLSEFVESALTLPVVGLMSYISAPGIPYQRLDRNKHDGLIIANARFYHEFVIGGSATLGSVWRDTVVRA